MPGNDDLYKGFEMFRDGMRQYHTTQAVNDATEKLKDLNSQEMDRQQQLVANQEIGNELALRLTAAGAKPEQINSATQGLIPSASSVYQIEGQKQEGAAARASAKDLKQMDIASEERIAQGKLDALGLGNEKKENEQYNKYATAFRKENKDLLGARDKMQALNSILQKTPDRVGTEMAKTGLLKFAGEDRVSDADVGRAQADPSLRAGIARRLKLELTGEAIKDDRKFYQAVLTHANSLINDNLSGKIRGYSQGLGELSGADPTRLESGLRKQLQMDDAKNAAKVEKSRQYSKTLNQTRIIYTDDTSKVVPGRQVK